MTCNMTDRLNCKLSSCASRYVTLCFLKHHLNFCCIVGDVASPADLVRTRSTMSRISSNTRVLSSAIDLAVSTASWEWTESAVWRRVPVCLSIIENKVIHFEMRWTSRPALATSQLTALRISDSLKPAPATPTMEAMTPVGSKS